LIGREARVHSEDEGLGTRGPGVRLHACGTFPSEPLGTRDLDRGLESARYQRGRGLNFAVQQCNKDTPACHTPTPTWVGMDLR